jgi:hypothetical protein
MGEQRMNPREGPGLSRRDFLTKGLAGRVALLLGSGAATPAGMAAEAAPPDLVPSVSSRDLRRMSREEVRAALARIRGRRRPR